MRIRSLILLYLTISVAFLGYSLLITILTPMFLHPLEGQFLQHLSAARRMIYLGCLLGLYPLAQFFSAPILGALSDKFGRRPVLCSSALVVTICYAAIAWSLQQTHLPLLYIAVTLCGLFEGMIAVSQGAITDLISPEQHSQYFGYIYMSISLAFVIGPLGGGLIAHSFSSATPFYWVACLTALMWLWMITSFKETCHKLNANISYTSAFTNLSGLWKKSKLRIVFGINALVYIAVCGFFRCYPVYLVAHFHMGVLEESIFIGYVSIPIVLTNAGLTAWLGKRFSISRIYIWATVITALGLILVILPLPKYFLWISLFIAGLGTALCLPHSAALIASRASSQQQGAMLGNNQALNVGMEALTGFAGGALAALWLPLPLLSFAVFALLGGMILYYKFA